MLGIDVRAARAAWTVFLLALLIAASYAIRVTLAVLLTSLFFAYMLMPVVNFVEARLPRRVPRTVALAIVYLILLGAIVGLGITIGGYIVEEANSLGSRLPQLVQNPDWMNHLPLPGWLEPLRARMINTIRTQVNGKDIMPYLQRVGEKVISSLSGLLFVVLVPILAFFFLKDGRQLRDSAVDSLRERDVGAVYPRAGAAGGRDIHFVLDFLFRDRRSVPAAACEHCGGAGVYSGSGAAHGGSDCDSCRRVRGLHACGVVRDLLGRLSAVPRLHSVA
jgi:predicted PurR-regulated permease PerM